MENFFDVEDEADQEGAPALSHQRGKYANIADLFEDSPRIDEIRARFAPET